MLRKLLAAALLTMGIALPARADTFWVTTLDAVLGLDPETLEVTRTIPVGKELWGTLYLMPGPDSKTAYLLAGGREVVAIVDMTQGKIRETWTLSEQLGEGHEAPRTARARFNGIALDASGTRILGNIVTSRRVGVNAYQLDRLTLDKPYLALLDARTGKRLATISDAPWATTMIVPMEDRAHPNRFLVVSPDLDVIDLDRLPKGKPPVRATFDQVRVRHVPLREPYMTGQGGVTILVEWYHPEPSKGLGSMPYYTTDPIVKKDQIGLVTVDMASGKVDVFELGPPQGPQYAFTTVVAPDRKKAYAVFNQLHEIDLEKRRLTRVKDLPYTYYACNISHDGKRLYLFSGGARVAIVDPATLEIVKEVELPTEVWDGFTMPD